MFYVKAQGDKCNIRVDITDENVFTNCPKCGKEMQIELALIAKDGELDLYGTQVYCEECTKLRKLKG